MRKFLFVSSVAWFIVLTSCQKEISGDFLKPAPSNDLTGTWKFLYSKVSATSTVDVQDEFGDVKSITLSNYVTQNNQGSLLINDSLMVTSGAAYDISTVASSYTYVDGNLEDSTDFPFSFSVPSTNSSSSYKRIGTDSIYVPGSSLTQVAGPTGLQSANGYKYKIISDTLLLSTLLDQTSTDNSSGVQVITNNKASVTSTLKKQ